MKTPLPIVTSERLATIACETIDKHAGEFQHMFRDKLPQVCNELKAFWKKEFDTSVNPAINDLIANGQAQASVASGLFHRNVRDHLAAQAVNIELGEELPKLFEAAKLKPVPLQVTHQMPLGIPMQILNPGTEIELMQMHTDVAPLWSKDEKLAIIAHELGHKKYGHTASTRATEFVADEFAVELTKKPEALKTAIDKTQIWGTGQAVQQIQQSYSRFLPDKAMKVVFSKSNVALVHKVMDAPSLRPMFERLNVFIGKLKHGMEHPLNSERMKAIDEVAARLGITIPSSASNQRANIR